MELGGNFSGNLASRGYSLQKENSNFHNGHVRPLFRLFAIDFKMSLGWAFKRNFKILSAKKKEKKSLMHAHSWLTILRQYN